MKIKDLTKKYKNEWILVEVVRETTGHQPIEVKVLSHSKDREEIWVSKKSFIFYLCPNYFNLCYF